MKIAAYLNNLSSDIASKVFVQFNELVNARAVKDASVFFDSAGFNPIDPKFGLFNSIDLWNFNGELFCFDINGAAYAKYVSNQFNIYFVYCEPVETIQLISITNNIKTIAIGQYQQEFIRLTGRMPEYTMQELNMTEIIKQIGEDNVSGPTDHSEICAGTKKP